jgi:Conserved oligomeric Golgi complex subunit 5, C-terminal
MGKIIYTLSPQRFPSQIRNAVSASAGTALLVIQRALSSGSMIRGGQTRSGGIDESRIIWTGLERAFKDVQKEAKGVMTLERGLSVSFEEEVGEMTTPNLLELAKEGKEGLDGVVPTAWFWREVAAGLEKRIKDSCRSKGPGYLTLTQRLRFWRGR